MTARYEQTVRALIDDIANVKRFVRCPVSDLAGPEHYYERGTGVVVGWDVLGDEHDTATVCPGCAEVVDRD